MKQYIIIMVSPHDNTFIVEAKSIEEAKQQIPVKWRASYAIAEYKGESMSEDLRSQVGAPEHDEEKYCVCGELLVECPDAYEHMSQGV